MKSIFVLFIAIAIAYPAQGFFLDTISNAVNSLASTVDSTINIIQTTANTAQFVGQFLWDNTFNPALQEFIGLGSNFIDDYFGGVLNALGKKREAELRIQLSAVQALFQTEAAGIISHFKSLFLEFINDAQTLILNSIIGLVFGQTTINDIMGQLLVKVRAVINEAVAYGVQTLDAALAVLGPQFAGLASGLQSTFVNLGVQFQSEINAVTSGIINAFNGALSVLYNNFSDLVQYLEGQVQSFMAEFNKILASSVLGLLFGITTVNDILSKIVATAQTYVMQSLQYTILYASLNYNNFLTAFQPFLSEAVGVVVQQLTGLGLISPIINIGPAITSLLTSIITP